MKPLVALLLLAARIAPGGELRQVSIDLDEIRDIVIRGDGGVPLRIRDVADVLEGK